MDFGKKFCLLLVTCCTCMTVQCIIFYITKILGKFMFIFSRVNPGIPGHGSIPDLTTESLILFIISRTLVVVCY